VYQLLLKDNAQNDYSRNKLKIVSSLISCYVLGLAGPIKIGGRIKSSRIVGVKLHALEIVHQETGKGNCIIHRDGQSAVTSEVFANSTE